MQSSTLLRNILLYKDARPLPDDGQLAQFKDVDLAVESHRQAEGLNEKKAVSMSVSGRVQLCWSALRREKDSPSHSRNYIFSQSRNKFN